MYLMDNNTARNRTQMIKLILMSKHVLDDNSHSDYYLFTIESSVELSQRRNNAEVDLLFVWFGFTAHQHNLGHMASKQER
jgi:hypothetical protein